MRKAVWAGLIAALLGGCGPEKPEPLDVAVIGRRADARWQQIEHGARAAAASVEYTVECWAPPQEDAQAQIKRIEGYLERGVKGLAIAASKPKAMTQVIQKAMAQGVPCITLDADAPRSGRLAFIGTDNNAVGFQAGRAMVTALTSRGQARGDVVIMARSLEARDARERLDGFREVMREQAGIAVVERMDDQGDAEAAREQAMSAIMRHRNLAAFYAAHPGSALACAQAVEQAGRKGEIKIVCIGATSDIMRRIEDGTITAAVAPRLHLMGKRAVELLWAIITKGPGRALKRLPEDRFLDAGSDLVTRRYLFERRREFERLGMPVDF